MAWLSLLIMLFVLAMLWPMPLLVELPPSPQTSLVTILHMFLLTMPHCLTICVSLTVWQESSQTFSPVMANVCEHSFCIDMKQLVSLVVKHVVCMLVEQTGVTSVRQTTSLEMLRV